MGITRLIDHKTLAAMAMQNPEFAGQLHAAGLIDDDIYDDLTDARTAAQINGANLSTLKQQLLTARNALSEAMQAHSNFIQQNQGMHNMAQAELDAGLQTATDAFEAAKTAFVTADTEARRVYDAAVTDLKFKTNSPSGIAVYLSDSPLSLLRSDEGVELTEQQSFDKVTEQIGRGQTPDAACFARLGTQIKAFAPIHKGITPGAREPGNDPTAPDSSAEFKSKVEHDRVLATVLPKMRVEYDGRFVPVANDSIGQEEAVAIPVAVVHSALTKELDDHPGETVLQAVRVTLNGDTRKFFDGMLQQEKAYMQKFSTVDTPSISGERDAMTTKGQAALRTVQVSTFLPEELEESYGVQPHTAEAVEIARIADLQVKATDFISEAKQNYEDRIGFHGPSMGGIGPALTSAVVVEEMEKLLEESDGAYQELVAGVPEQQLFTFEPEAEAHAKLNAAHKLMQLREGGLDIEQMKATRDDMFSKELEMFCQESLRLGMLELAPAPGTEKNVATCSADLGLKAFELLHAAPNAEKAKRAKFVIEGMTAVRKQIADEFLESRRKQGVAKTAEKAATKVMNEAEAKLQRLQDQLNSDQHRTARQQRKLVADYQAAQTDSGKKRLAVMALQQEQKRLQDEQKTLRSHSYLAQKARDMKRDLETNYMTRTHKEHRDDRKTQPNPYKAQPGRLVIQAGGYTQTKGNEYKAKPNFSMTFSKVRI